MNRTKLLGQPQRPAVSWDVLMQRAIQLAQERKDSRLKILQQGAQAGRTQATLKRLGIIGEADLTREFPPRT